MNRPDPRKRAQRELEHARPVDADERWIVGEPAFEIAQPGSAIFRIAGEPRGAPEDEPVLMAVQLPDDFVIAATWIEVSHVGPEPAGRAALAHGVGRAPPGSPPIDTATAGARGGAVAPQEANPPPRP